MNFFSVRPIGISECKLACAEMYPFLEIDRAINKPGMLKNFLMARLEAAQEQAEGDKKKNLLDILETREDEDEYSFLDPYERHKEFAHWVDRCAPRDNPILKPGKDWIKLTSSLVYFGVHWKDQVSIQKALGAIEKCENVIVFATITANVQLLLSDPWSLAEMGLCFLSDPRAALGLASEKAQAVSTGKNQHNPCIVVYEVARSFLFGVHRRPHSRLPQVECILLNRPQVNRLSKEKSLISVIELHLS